VIRIAFVPACPLNLATVMFVDAMHGCSCVQVQLRHFTPRALEDTAGNRVFSGFRSRNWLPRDQVQF